MIILRIIKKFQNILSRHQKFRVVELLFLMVIGGFMEMLSVSMMLPFITTIMEPGKVMENRYVMWVMDSFKIQTDRSFLVFLALTMAVIYLFKNIFLLFQMTIQEKFVQNNMFELQKNLMHSFMSRSYEFFLSAHSGEIIRIVSKDTEQAFLGFNALISLFAELIVSFILLVTILVISPFLTIIMGIILLTVTVLIYKFSKSRLRKSGEKEISSYAGMSQTLLQSIQGIKEIKLMQKESFFQKRYEKDGAIYVRGRYISQLLSLIPRFALEAVAMCSFFVILAVMIYKGAEIEMLLPIVSAIAMAAVRLLPSMNRISNALSLLTYFEPAVDKMLENLRNVNDTETMALPKMLVSTEKQDKILPLTNNITLYDIIYKYPTGHQPVLNHANLEIRRGQSVGIVGASGSGKTTAVDLILGLLKPQNGNVLADGKDIELDLSGWLSQFGYIPQTIFMLDGNIRENVAFGYEANEIDDRRVWEALKEASLDEYVRSLPEGLDTEIGERGIRISGGQRQRIGIARALYSDPEILFFDEATSALDNETEAAIMDSINHLHGKKTMVIIAHRLTTIESCDVIYRVENGKIIKERG